MSAQAKRMKTIVDELVSLVGRSTGSGPGEKKTKATYPAGTVKMGHRHAPARAVPSCSSAKAVAPGKAKEVTPEQVIPLDGDDNLDDF